VASCAQDRLDGLDASWSMNSRFSCLRASGKRTGSADEMMKWSHVRQLISQQVPSPQRRCGEKVAYP